MPGAGDSSGRVDEIDLRSRNNGSRGISDDALNRCIWGRSRRSGGVSGENVCRREQKKSN